MVFALISPKQQAGNTLQATNQVPGSEWKKKEERGGEGRKRGMVDRMDRRKVKGGKGCKNMGMR